MAHHCHATDCAREVPPEMFMCRRHWFMLPRRLRNQIWQTYREGQCDDWEPSVAYCDAAIEAVTFIAEVEDREPDVQLYKVFRRRAAR